MSMVKVIDDSFDSLVFSDLMVEKRDSKHKVASKIDKNFDTLVEKELLNFESLMKHDATAKVQHIDMENIKITFSKHHLAFNLKQMFSQDNPDLEFSDDYYAMEPDEELIKKSKLPLWVIKMLKPGCVLIQKMAY